ncbi:MAG: hypothetical protein JL50_00790 [Peptococcaceae bacterium BICA1-7]|nr:MAG: hypothetical protein JL50_00790 [Peptococcaceae bacterium BICA1-7]HBV98075.1 hypothetical protein [Desulfotomaculum sp.]
MIYLKLIFVILIIIPIAFFVGYKLRTVIPKKKRLATGFIVAFTILTILLGIDLLVPTINISQTGIGTAIAISFPLGLAGPPFKKN